MHAFAQTLMALGAAAWKAGCPVRFAGKVAAWKAAHTNHLQKRTSSCAPERAASPFLPCAGEAGDVDHLVSAPLLHARTTLTPQLLSQSLTFSELCAGEAGDVDHLVSALLLCGNTPDPSYMLLGFLTPLKLVSKHP